MKRDLLSILDLSPQECEELFTEARLHKERKKTGQIYQPLKGKTLGMIFEKSSTRTKVSFEVGMYQLGGQVLFLTPETTQIGRGEPCADTARVLSGYVDGIVIRAFEHRTLEDFSLYASVPVINGLTNLLHPCQILTDIFTIMEKKGDYRGIKIAYIGDGNNVANSWILAASLLEIDLVLACPQGYEPDNGILKKAKDLGFSLSRILREPKEAARKADIIYTDVWVSMGQENEYPKRMKAFQGYQVNKALLALAHPQCLVMHCLPARRGEEITEEVIEGPSSIVFYQAENRLHVQKAILEKFLLATE